MARTPKRGSIFTVWKRGIARGAITMVREKEWMTVLGTLTSVFLILQILVFVLVSVEGLQDVLRSRADIRLEMKAQATEQQIQSFHNAVQGLPYVAESVYITQQKAYDEMKKHDPELIAFLEEFNFENPFPNTIAVTLTSLDQYDVFRKFLEQGQWAAIVDPNFVSQTTEQEVHIYELISLTNTMNAFALFFLVLTGGTLLFMMVDIVRRRVLERAEEVLVEHLSGASTFSTVLPFATEATIYIVISLLTSTAILIVVLMLLPSLIPAFGTYGVLSALSETVGPLLMNKIPLIILIELLLSPILGFIGAWMGIVPKISTRALMLHR